MLFRLAYCNLLIYFQISNCCESDICFYAKHKNLSSIQSPINVLSLIVLLFGNIFCRFRQERLLK